MCVLHLGDIFSVFLQGLKQVSKFVQTKETCIRKRIYVSIVFVCAGVYTCQFSTIHPLLFSMLIRPQFYHILSTPSPTCNICGGPQWMTPEKVSFLFTIAGTNSAPIIELNSSKRLNHIKRILFVSNSQKHNFLGELLRIALVKQTLSLKSITINQNIIPVVTLQEQYGDLTR